MRRRPESAHAQPVRVRSQPSRKCARVSEHVHASGALYCRLPVARCSAMRGTAQRDSSATTYDRDHWIACRLCSAGIRAAAAHKSEPTTESTAYYSAGKASGVKTKAVSCVAALVDVRHGLTSSAYDTMLPNGGKESHRSAQKRELEARRTVRSARQG